MGGGKLTRIQREDAKIYVRECVISKFSRDESLAYVKQKLGRQDITIFDIYRIKVALKKDTAKWMNSLKKDRWAYVAQYKERVDEYYKHGVTNIMKLPWHVHKAFEIDSEGSGSSRPQLLQNLGLM